MKVVLLDSAGAVVGYTAVGALPVEAPQQIPDLLEHRGVYYALQPREAFPEALGNCEAVFKQAILGDITTPVYADKVDGLALRTLEGLKWFLAQPRDVVLIDDPQTQAMVGRGEALLAATAPLHPHNAQVLQDLRVAVAEARYWMKPDPGTARAVVQARNRHHIAASKTAFAQAMLHPQNEEHP
ncbi:hypothetical protein MARCHEWKA_04970 [Brevundimonas phage vB_BpoS-Marchewka]|uniref:Uncharacterized protein n=1 Tax=Brevundimonas phage vB_BpoS-Marchewka TaxID=2948604 RepID=A0A9E7N612_9CAUD|nr:hypothetical protein MARCHEWKA_04970 [Brevundimonas phage vB_BpoS-Marchewka]